MKLDLIVFAFGVAAGAVPLGIILRQVIRGAQRDRAIAHYSRVLRGIRVGHRDPIAAGLVPVDAVVGTAE